ncbi:hypothetical protein HDV57DRAFT_25240 [Trichoderma longibrachiatum]
MLTASYRNASSPSPRLAHKQTRCIERRFQAGRCDSRAGSTTHAWSPVTHSRYAHEKKKGCSCGFVLFHFPSLCHLISIRGLRMTIPVPRPHFHRRSLFRVHAEIWEGGGVRVSWLPPASWRLLYVEPFNLLCASLAVILFSYLHYAPYLRSPSISGAWAIHLCVSRAKEWQRAFSCLIFIKAGQLWVLLGIHCLAHDLRKGHRATAAAVCSLFPSPVRSVVPCRLPPDCF